MENKGMAGVLTADGLRRFIMKLKDTAIYPDEIIGFDMKRGTWILKKLKKKPARGRNEIEEKA